MARARTPVWDAGRVYAVGAAGDLVALDAATGKQLWRRDILEENDAKNIRWGVSASPIIAGDLVVTVPGAAKGRAVVAYDKITGEPRWHALSDAASYTTPIAVSLAGRPQLLVVTASRAVGLDLADGSLLWEQPWATDMGINAAQPIVVGENRFMLSAGYDHGAVMVEIRARRRATRSARGVGNQSDEEQAELVGLPRRPPLRARRRHPRVPRRRDRRAALEERKVRTRPAPARAGPLIVLTEDGELALVEAKHDAFVERARFAAIDGPHLEQPGARVRHPPGPQRPRDGGLPPRHVTRGGLSRLPRGRRARLPAAGARRLDA